MGRNVKFRPVQTGQIVQKPISYYFDQEEMFRVMILAVHWYFAMKVRKIQNREESNSYSQSTNMKMAGKCCNGKRCRELLHQVQDFWGATKGNFLCHAYQLAITNMNTWTWHRCCNEACRLLNNLGLNQALFYNTVAIWNQVFRKFECFSYPNPYFQCGKRPLPRLLEVFPDAKDQIVAFGIKNLAMPTIERVLDHMIRKDIPRLMKT